MNKQYHTGIFCDKTCKICNPKEASFAPYLAGIIFGLIVVGAFLLIN